MNSAISSVNYQSNPNVMCYREIRRGDLFFAKLPKGFGGSVQEGERPVLVIQNNLGNRHSPTLIVSPLTSQEKKALPTHVEVKQEEGLKKTSTVLCEQIQTIGKDRLLKYIGSLSKATMDKITQALITSIGQN